MHQRHILGILLALVLAAAVPAAAEDVIFAGVDAFETVSRMTYADLTTDPIPAGFFCPESTAFSGKILLKGVPITTVPAGALGNADTIFQRLDDTTLDSQGVGHTRLQIKALSLVSQKPIATRCGLFNVAVSLAGQQPISPAYHMTIVRENEKGGYFLAEFRVRYRLTFTPVDGRGEPRQLVRTSTFIGGRDHHWAFEPGIGNALGSTVRIDTNGDGLPDASVPAPSNFAVGRRAGELLFGPGNSLPPEIFTSFTVGCGGTHAIC
ncbi:MAG TPA: hypothetical protein PK413_13555 [Thermoanaerobaculia bacterium]|nr:hypothetical protein [Thermoanaerobaculia bacterium]